MADPGKVTPDKKLPRQASRIVEFKSDTEGHELTSTGQKIVLVQITKKEETRKELLVRSKKTALPSQPNQKKTEDTAATLVKAPVVWSPLTVKAAVSKLSEVQHAVKSSPAAPTVPKQDEGSDSLPGKTVAWSPLTVQAAVNRLSAIHQDQPPPSAGNAFGSTVSPKQSRPAPPVMPQVTPPVSGQREIRVIQTGRYHRSKVLQGPWNQVGDNLLRGRFKCLPKTMMKVPGFKDIMVAEVLKVLDKECETLTSLTFNSVLRDSDPVSLKNFHWKKVMKEWKTAAPTFLKFLQHASKVFENSAADQMDTPTGRSLPMAMGGALLLRARSSSMCAPMYINSMILQQGGTEKRCFDKLNKVGVCMSHRRTRMSLKDADETQDSKLARWEEETGETEEMDTTSSSSDEDNRGSSYEEGDSDIAEITYIVS